MRSPNGANVTGRDRARRPTSPRGRFGPAGTHQSIRNDAGPEDRQPSRTGDGTWDRSGAGGRTRGKGHSVEPTWWPRGPPSGFGRVDNSGPLSIFRPGSAADCDRAGWTAPGGAQPGTAAGSTSGTCVLRRDRIVAAASSSRIIGANPSGAHGQHRGHGEDVVVGADAADTAAAPWPDGRLDRCSCVASPAPWPGWPRRAPRRPGAACERSPTPGRCRPARCWRRSPPAAARTRSAMHDAAQEHEAADPPEARVEADA